MRFLDTQLLKCIIYILFQLIDRLNKYRLCLSSSKNYVVYADIGKHFLDHAVELVKSGKEII